MARDITADVLAAEIVDLLEKRLDVEITDEDVGAIVPLIVDAIQPLRDQIASLRAVVDKLPEYLEAIEAECICHETVIGKAECPVHGKPAQAKGGE
jgi:hypothetical protein